MVKLASNIKVLRELKKVSQEDLSAQLDITRSRLGAYEEGRNEPPLELVLKLADHFHISVDALLRADLSKTDPEALLKIGKNRILFPVIVDKDNNETIEVITIKASAGYLNGYSDPDYMEKLPRMKLPFNVVGKNRGFPIKGDSMLPLKDGSYVIATYIESISQVKDGKTYIVLTKNDGLVYKRVYKKTNALELHSDNKLYEPYTVKGSDVLELWEFVCSFNTSDKEESEASLGNMFGMLKNIQQEMKSMRK